jgi:hypothetical protein
MVGAPVDYWWSTKYAASHVSHSAGWQEDGVSVSSYWLTGTGVVGQATNTDKSGKMSPYDHLLNWKRKWDLMVTFKVHGVFCEF